MTGKDENGKYSSEYKTGDKVRVKGRYPKIGGKTGKVEEVLENGAYECIVLFEDGKTYRIWEYWLEMMDIWQIR